MIAKGTPHDNGGKLARYLTTGKEGERAELWQLRGFASPDIAEAFRCIHVIAEGTKTQQPFFHVQVRNPEGEQLTRDQWEKSADRIERMLGLKDQPRAIAFHINEQTGEEHMHIAWSRIDAETMKAIPLPFYKERLKKVSRELELHFGLTQVTSQRDSEIKFAPTRDEEEQARRLGIDIHAVRETIRSCYKSSDCGRSFENALAHEGLVLAAGDKRDYVVIDEAGGLHALGKRILDISAAQVRVKLTDLNRDHVPTVEQAKEFVLTRELSAVQQEIKAENEYAKRDPVREEMAWEDALAKAAIAKEKIEGKFIERGTPAARENGQAPVLERELNKAAGSIRLAYNLTDGPEAFREHLQREGLTVARVVWQDIRERDSAGRQEKKEATLDAWDKTRLHVLDAEQNLPATPEPGKPSGRLSDYAREGDVVVLDKWGNIYELNRRTTGETRQESQAFVCGIGSLPSVSHARRELEEERQQQRSIRVPTGPQQAGMVAQQMWAVRHLQQSARERYDEQRRAEEYQRQKEERRHEQETTRKATGEVDPERYLADPDYRRQVRAERSFMTQQERKTEKENDLRALLEQQDRQR